MRDANNYWHHVKHVPGTKDVQHLTYRWQNSAATVCCLLCTTNWDKWRILLRLLL